jgi:hypothetical protein
MNTLRDELNEVIYAEKIVGLEFARINKWQWVMERLADQFLSHGRQSLNRIWLWDSVKEPYTSYQPDDSIQELKALLKPDETCRFIASDEDGKYWVLQGTAESIIKVLSEMRCFEYYITDENISWLISENHHGSIVLKGSIEARRANA